MFSLAFHNSNSTSATSSCRSTLGRLVQMKMVEKSSSLVLILSLVVLLICMKSCHGYSHVRRVLLSNQTDNYAVIFDAGSTGSRVHVFRFSQSLDLLPIGNGLEVYDKIKPGLSAYASDPKAAAKSLEPLLLKAESVIPIELQPDTPVELGATAGLRMLKGDAAERILQSVRDMLKNESSFEYKAEWVSILSGTQEGSYFWVALNYLLRSLGKGYQNTAATIDLGGGSVQMAFALSKENAAKAPLNFDGEKYVLQKSLMGANYYLYVHSYLNYGFLAARAEILKISRNSTSPCILKGTNGYYTYGGVAYKASPTPNGSSFRKCRRIVRKALKLNEPCKYKKCTFNGVWNGGGVDGFKTIYISSFFFEMAYQVDIIDPKASSGKAKPIQYLNAAKIACKLKAKEVKSVFLNVDNQDLPYLCMDVLYQFTLLVDGFGLDPYREITLVHDVNYKNNRVEAAWPLGCAIDVVSSSFSRSRISSS